MHTLRQSSNVPPQVVPRARIVRRNGNLVEGIVDLFLALCLKVRWDGAPFFEPAPHTEPAVVVSTVVAHVCLEHLVDIRELALPQCRKRACAWRFHLVIVLVQTAKVRKHPLTVGPRMVVFAVEVQDGAGKRKFAARIAEHRHNYAAVLPG